MTWEEQARCRQVDPEIFFARGARTERKAKAICLRCDVRDLCLAFALDSRTEFGVWGGLNGSERRSIAARGGSPWGRPGKLQPVGATA